MFLASAGRVYSRKTSQEEFTRYVYDCDVVHTLICAIIRLYELPIKPLNLKEFFAEYIEDDAKELGNISMLRAELCYKKSEAQDLMKKLEKLNKELFPGESDQSGKKLFTDFLQDGKTLPGMLSARTSVIFKTDERKLGGESVGGYFKNVQPTPENSTQKQDPSAQYLQDMIKLDPWGIIFPAVHQPGTIPQNFPRLSSDQPKKEGQVKAQPKENSTKEDTDHAQKHPYSTPNHPQNSQLDDSKSLAELYYRQQHQTDPDPFKDLLDHDEPPVEGYHKWDKEYWTQFFKSGSFIQDGDPEIAEKLSLLRQWASSHEVKRGSSEMQYLYSHILDTKVADSAVNLNKMPIPNLNSPTTRQYELNDVWTASKFAKDKLPLHLLERSTNLCGSKRKASKSVQRVRSKLLEEEPDVVDTEVSVGDPSLHCGSPVRTYSKAMSQHHRSKSVTSIPHTPTPSRTALPLVPSCPVAKKKRSAYKKVKIIRRGETPRGFSRNQSEYTMKDEESTRRVDGTSSALSGKVEYRPKKQHLNYSLSEEEMEPKCHSARQTCPTLPKIRQSSVPIPHYEGDGPKQVPFSHKCESDCEKKKGTLLKTSSSAKVRRVPGSEHSHASKMDETRSLISSRGEESRGAVTNLCDPREVAKLHPYPELLTLTKHKSKREEDKKKANKRVDKFLRFFNQHYDKGTVEELQEDYDFSLFDGML